MKRFTATEKWEKPWYQELPPHLKCLWQYMCDKCDAAGVWEPNWKVASMFIGKAVSESDLARFDGRVAKLKGGKILIGSFLDFQYGKLSEDCRAHIPIFRLIEKHRVSNGYTEAMHSLKEQEKEKEEEKEKEPEKDTPTPIANKGHGSLDEIKAFCASENIPASDAEWFFNKCVGNGWKNNGSAIKDWRATLRAWKAAHYLPSQKNGARKSETFPLTTPGPKGWDPTKGPAPR